MDIRGFLESQFSWESIFGNLIWMVIGSIIFRLWMKFTGYNLEKRKEIGFWVLCPFSILFVVVLLSYAQTQNSVPKINMSIEKIIFNAPDGSDASATDILLFVSARNIGADTIIEWKELTIQIGKERPIETDRMIVPEILNIRDPKTNKIAIFSGQDAIYNKTTDQPVSKGSMKRGLLFFRTKGISRDAITQTGTVYRLTCVDVLGKHHVLEYPLPSQLSPIDHYIPGIKMQIKKDSYLSEQPAIEANR